jgi:hypothetical protein
MMRSSGVDEFATVLGVLKERSRRASRDRPASVGPKWAMAERTLWTDFVEINGQQIPREVHSLSPSDGSMTLAYHGFRRLLSSVEGSTKRRIVSQSPNYVAVVLWMRIGAASLLLGSDLEETRNTGTGWSVIVDSPTRPAGKAQILKVPHHGSHTAHQQAVWDTMLETAPVAVLTPFVQGSVRLPSDSDARRICQQTPNVYVTAMPAPRRRGQRPRAVERTIRETVRYIRESTGPLGHVRLRSNIDPSVCGEWRVELFGSARALTA